LAEIDSGINGSSLEGVTDLEKETWNWGNWCVVVTEQQGRLSVQDFFLSFLSSSKELCSNSVTVSFFIVVCV
jgi:hypothetical protein